MLYQHKVNFWPLVPALDIQSITEAESTPIQHLKDFDTPYCYQSKILEPRSLKVENNTNPKTFNCLIVGDGIGCLMKTVSRMFRHSSVDLNIYMVTTFPEALARNLLLLSLLGDTLGFSLLDKAEIFLEILGNTQIRSSSKLFLMGRSEEIIGKIGYLKEGETILPIASTNYLKQKEIDSLVEVLNYLKGETKIFDVSKYWENALRSFFGTRYDNRRNLFDYQFNMKLTDYRMISLRKYLHWCETGVAFKFRQAKYTYPNKTLHLRSTVSGNKDQNKECYIGDIATSPYLVFGVETGNENMLKKSNNEYTCTSEDISKFNIIDMMQEFISLSKEQNDKRVMVHMMFFETMCKTKKFDKYFDAVYVSCDMMPCIGQLLPTVVKDRGVVVFETIRNVVNSTKEQKAQYSAAIDRIASSSGLEKLQNDYFNKNRNFKMFLLKNANLPVDV